MNQLIDTLPINGNNHNEIYNAVKQSELLITNLMINIHDYKKRMRIYLNTRESISHHLTEGGYELINAISTFHYNEQFLNNHALQERNPYLKLFIDTFYDLKLWIYIAHISQPTHDSLTRNLTEKFYNVLYCTVHSDSFERLMRREARASIKNARSLNNYIKSLFIYRSKILVVRVDLSYLKGSVNPNDPNLHDYITHDRDKFLHQLRRSQGFKHLIGYVWKLEYGLDKGYHIHFLAFFDGSKVQSDHYYAKWIGEAWQNYIATLNTDRVGMYFNCSTQQYRERYLGLVGWQVSEKLEYLFKHSQYLTKYDILIGIYRDWDGARTFGRGELRSNSNLGRPRLYNA